MILLCFIFLKKKKILFKEGLGKNKTMFTSTIGQIIKIDEIIKQIKIKFSNLKL